MNRDPQAAYRPPEQQIGGSFEPARTADGGGLACGFWPGQSSSQYQPGGRAGPISDEQAALSSLARDQHTASTLALQQRDLCQKLLECFSTFREEQLDSNDTLRIGNYKTVKLVKDQSMVLEQLQGKLLAVELQQCLFREEMHSMLEQRTLASAGAAGIRVAGAKDITGTVSFAQDVDQQQVLYREWNKGVDQGNSPTFAGVRQDMHTSTPILDSYIQTELGPNPNARRLPPIFPSVTKKDQAVQADGDNAISSKQTPSSQKDTYQAQRAVLFKPMQPVVHHADTDTISGWSGDLETGEPSEQALKTWEDQFSAQARPQPVAPPPEVLPRAGSPAKDMDVDAVIFEKQGRSSSRGSRDPRSMNRPKSFEELASQNEAPDIIEEEEETVAPDEIAAEFDQSNWARQRREAVYREVNKHIEEKAGLDKAKAKNAKNVNYFQGGHMFPDASELKEHVRHAILHPYDVAQLYHEGGMASKIASSEKFEMLTMGVIAFNAIWMAVDVDTNGSLKLRDKHFIFQAMEWAFFAYFFFEWCVRFSAFQDKCAGFRDKWFAFDSALVLLMAMDAFMPIIFGDAWGSKTSILRVVRLVKIVRMARVAKLFRHFPELLVLLKAIAIASRSVASTMILLGSMTYVFAVAFRYLTVDSELSDKYFNSTLHAMKSLLFEVCLPDGMNMVNKLGDENIMYGVLATFFIIAGSVTLLNMLIGVLCEVIGVVSQVERESMKVTFVKEKLTAVLMRWDLNHDMLVSESEFHKLLLDPDALRVLRQTGVDPLGLVDFTEYIFGGEFNDVSKDGLGFDKFVDLIMRLGGGNTATVKDIVDLRKMITHKLEVIEDRIAQVAAPSRQSITNRLSTARSPITAVAETSPALSDMSCKQLPAITNGNGC